MLRGCSRWPRSSLPVLLGPAQARANLYGILRLDARKQKGPEASPRTLLLPSRPVASRLLSFASASLPNQEEQVNHTRPWAAEQRAGGRLGVPSSAALPGLSVQPSLAASTLGARGRLQVEEGTAAADREQAGDVLAGAADRTASSALEDGLCRRRRFTVLVVAPPSIIMWAAIFSSRGLVTCLWEHRPTVAILATVVWLGCRGSALPSRGRPSAGRPGGPFLPWGQGAPPRCSGRRHRTGAPARTSR